MCCIQYIYVFFFLDKINAALVNIRDKKLCITQLHFLHTENTILNFIQIIT